MSGIVKRTKNKNHQPADFIKLLTKQREVLTI